MIKSFFKALSVLFVVGRKRHYTFKMAKINDKMGELKVRLYCCLLFYFQVSKFECFTWTMGYMFVGAPARVGLVTPIDVVVTPGNTGLDPSQTSFFKINKGTVEIITHVELIKKGEKVGSSEAALLAKLGIRSFLYGQVLTVYDNGSFFSHEVLDLTDEDLMGKFVAGVSMVTSLSLVIAYATLATAPHIFINAYKNLLAVAFATEYSFPQAEQVNEYLKDLSKFAAAAPAAAFGSAADLWIFRSFVAALVMVPFAFPLGLKLWESCWWRE
ncbi:hypothetical protein MKX03_026803 [Papaver bracteatum]|nr:hypothetical protein MKX03_026803 [Papaver bracteatum]